MDTVCGPTHQNRVASAAEADVDRLDGGVVLRAVPALAVREAGRVGERAALEEQLPGTGKRGRVEPVDDLAVRPPRQEIAGAVLVVNARVPLRLVPAIGIR